jgi:hypothetical protein
MDFSKLAATGLRQKGELEALFNVSRPMVNRYLRNHTAPRGMRADRIESVMAILAVLVERGKLPFPASVDNEVKRRAAAEKLLAYVESKLK